MDKKMVRSVSFIVYLTIIAIITGCSSPIPQATDLPATATSIPPSHTSQPSQTLSPTSTATLTPLPPTPTPEPTSTATMSPTETSTPTPTVTLAPATAGSGLPSASGDVMWIYFIKLKTGGTVGCGDSAVAMGSGVPQSGDISKDVEAALEVLFTYRDEYYGELYNPLFRSNIRVESVSFRNGLITVKLRGTYKPSGDKCDNTRVKAQVWSTIRQYRVIKATNIYLNNIPFGDRVSND